MPKKLIIETIIHDMLEMVKVDNPSLEVTDELVDKLHSYISHSHPILDHLEELEHAPQE